MKPIANWQGYWLFLLALALNACTGVSVKEPVAGDEAVYKERAEKISAISEWSLIGRISLDDGEDGGSGRLQWAVRSEDSELDFHGAMGRGAWNLKIGPQMAVLKEANGAMQTATAVNDLIQDRMGWPVPVDALQWWVRGVAAPGMVDDQKIDAEGRLTQLVQFGWNVRFSRYDTVAGLSLPVRLDARRENYRVKLAVSRWQLGAGAKQH